MTKKTSTPTKPPGRKVTPACPAMTVSTAMARRPCTSPRNVCEVDGAASAPAVARLAPGRVIAPLPSRLSEIIKVAEALEKSTHERELSGPEGALDMMRSRLDWLQRPPPASKEETMQSNNPVFRRSEEFNRAGQPARPTPATATRRRGRPVSPASQPAQGYEGCPAGASSAGPMTIDTVVQKTAISLGVVIVTALATWILTPDITLATEDLGPLFAALTSVRSAHSRCRWSTRSSARSARPWCCCSVRSRASPSVR